jgi:hypothetical protein
MILKLDIELERLLAQSLKGALSYEDYLKLVVHLAFEGKSTGPNQSEAYVQYTQLNTRRMKRWNKTLKLTDGSLLQIKSLNRPLIWLVLTESWCGDASPALPVMDKIAQANAKIDLRIVLRDEHPELMNRFLTKGAMSIPKLIQLEPSTMNVLGTWGPRSTIATKMVEDFKAAHGSLTPAFREELQIWYNKDKGKSIVEDLLKLLTLK